MQEKEMGERDLRREREGQNQSNDQCRKMKEKRAIQLMNADTCISIKLGMMQIDLR